MSFTNFIQYVFDSKKIKHVYIFTNNENVEIPEYLTGRVSLIKFSSRGELRLARVFKSSKLLDIFSSLKYKTISQQLNSIGVGRDDIFFYEEFYFGNLKKYLKGKYDNRHIIRVHGTMPEFVTFDKSNKYREIFFRQAFDSDEKFTVATTSVFYIKFINQYLLKNKYDLIKRVNYIVLPNSVYGGIDVEHMVKKESDSINFLQLGRMDKGGYFQKGFDDTLKAFKYLEAKWDEPKNINLITIGDGEVRSEFQKSMTFLKNIKCTHYTSLKNTQVREMIFNADVILLPSRCEGMSMFAVEAISLGKPIITTRNTGVDDICIEGVNSLKFDAYNYVELANLIEAVSDNPGMLHDLSNGSFKISLTNEAILKSNIEAFL
ncbi:glycosyltransferase family 4 protein [Edwardsiella tarda]|uniref:glycosyltransferase family 4 protein n=1 Tax=Edwardsiella tarda TaxID=636 RepID=UPI0034DD0DDB